MHGCKASYISTAPVTEVFEGKTVWEGDVEVFALSGHPRAQRCYAWALRSDSQMPSAQSLRAEQEEKGFGYQSGYGVA
jgi:hypothetical protein